MWPDLCKLLATKNACKPDGGGCVGENLKKVKVAKVQFQKNKIVFHLFIKQIQKCKSDMSTWVDVGGGVVDDRDGFNIVCLMWLSFSSGREACMANTVFL